MRGKTRGRIVAIGALAALVSACSEPSDGVRSLPTTSPGRTASPSPTPEGVRTLAAGADEGRSHGPVVEVTTLPATNEPVLAAFGFKSVEGTEASVDSVEGGGATWRKVYEPERETSGGVSLWVGEGVTGGTVTVTFSGPLEAGRLGWTFDVIPDLDPRDPFVQILQSEPTDATHKEVRLPIPPSGPVYGFILVGIGGGRGIVQPGDGLDLLGQGQGPVINVSSVWSEDPREAIEASWATPASNILVGAELRTS